MQFTLQYKVNCTVKNESMEMIKIFYISKYKHALILLIFLAFTSLILGIMEGIFTYYYEFLIIQNYNFIEKNIISIKSIKEFGMILIILIFIILTNGKFLKKTANFLFMYSIKNLSYFVILFIYSLIPYSSLILFIKLFIFSFIMIIGSLIIHATYEVTGKLKFTLIEFFLIFLSSIILLFSLNIKLDWILFMIGIILLNFEYFITIRKNWIKK